MQAIDEEVKKQSEYVEALKFMSEKLADELNEVQNKYQDVSVKYRTEKQHLQNLISYQKKGTNV